MTYKSFNEYHLGDNLIHLHFLRKLALAHPEHIFEHAVHAAHREQLLPIVEDLSNVRLTGIGHPSIMDDLKKDRAWRNVWKNANDRWGRHPRRNQFAEYYLGWFSDLAHEMGLPTPFHKPADLLFDYPAIGRVTPAVAGVADGLRTQWPDGTVMGHIVRDCWFDFLIVNSQPCSGQFRAFDHPDYLNPLIEELAAEHRIITTATVLRTCPAAHRGPLPPAIPCTRDFNMSITDIGTLSLRCKHLLMVSTGPSWPTFNTSNLDSVALRLVFLDCDEIVDYAPNTVQCNRRELAREILIERKLL